jgi:hypothetical protein
MLTCDFVGESRGLTICAFVHENTSTRLFIGVLSVVVIHIRFPREFVDPYFICLGFVLKPTNMGV